MGVEVGGAGGKGIKHLLGTYHIPRAVYHFTTISHITLGTTIPILNSLALCLKIQYFHDLNECRGSEASLMEFELIWGIYSNSQSQNTLVLKAASLLGPM